MRITWFPCAVAACLAALALAPAASPAATNQQIGDAVAAATSWFRAQQTPATGSFGNNSGLDPAWALLGIAGSGLHAADFRAAPGQPSAQDYYLGLWTGPDDNAWTSLGGPQATDYERVVLLARASGLDPLRLSAGQNLLAKLAGYYRDGWFTSKTSLFNHTLFGLLALEQVPVPSWLVERTAQIVEANRHADGGYTSYPVTNPATYNATSDVDSTGVAIAALCGAGRTATDPAVAGGLAFLRGKRSPSGAIGNVDSTSWALDGMGACGVRRGSVAWTAEDETTVDWLLSTQLTSGPAAGAWGTGSSPNAYGTQDALRALTAAGFAVPPPPRTQPGEPLLRPPPAVANGTSVPVVLAIDAGFGDIRLCSTSAAVGASLADVLAAARAGSQPSGCVDDFEFGAGGLRSIDGAVSGAGSGGGWKVSLGGGAEQSAGPQQVGFGDVVALRLDDPHPLRLASTSLDFAGVPVGLIGGTREAELVNRDDTAVLVERPRVTGAAAGDFAVAAENCDGETLLPGASCTVVLRFAPSAPGLREATLEVAAEGSDGAAPIGLRGEGVAMQAGPPGAGGDVGAPGNEGDPGTPGSSGDLGAAGLPGKPGADGAKGPAGSRGERGGAGSRGPRGPRGGDGRHIRVSCARAAHKPGRARVGCNRTVLPDRRAGSTR